MTRIQLYIPAQTLSGKKMVMQLMLTYNLTRYQTYPKNADRRRTEHRQINLHIRDIHYTDLQSRDNPFLISCVIHNFTVCLTITDPGD